MRHRNLPPAPQELSHPRPLRRALPSRHSTSSAPPTPPYPPWPPSPHSALRQLAQDSSAAALTMDTTFGRSRDFARLLIQYGDCLVCVRYRHDAQRKKQFKTLELLVAERGWQRPPPRVAADTIVGVRVGFAEVEIRAQVKQAGGKWNPSSKVWELRYDQAVALKLQARIAGARASSSRCHA